MTMSSSSAVLDESQSTRTTRPVLNRQDSKVGVDSRFCCNICLEAVVDPVATLCGHLYCWPCLFRWLEPGMHPEERASLGILILQQPLSSIDTNRRVCPVCKAPCSVPTLVPIYVRESSDALTPTDNETAATATATAKAKAKSSGEDGEIMEAASAEHLGLESTSSDNSQGDSNYLQAHSMDSGLSGTSITGLRQRIRFRSRDSENSTDSVPSRPPANSPQQEQQRHHHHQQQQQQQQFTSASPSNSTPPTPQRYRSNSWVAPLTPTSHRGSLTHGLLLSLQQAAGGTSGVPPLHRRDGLHPAELDAHPGATEYLTRLLIMLTSFVVLCLLLL